MSKISVESKFSVGQDVQIKGTGEHFKIDQIVTTTCSGGTQIQYEGWIVFDKAGVYKKATRKLLGEPYNEDWVIDYQKKMLMNEVHLEEIKEEIPDEKNNDTD